MIEPEGDFDELTVDDEEGSATRPRPRRPTAGIDDNLYILVDDEPVPELDFLKWGRWFEEADRVVKRTELDGGAVEVSTIFLGLDQRRHGHREGPPLLWESLIFGGLRDGQGARYASAADAIAGHDDLVRMALDPGELED